MTSDDVAYEDVPQGVISANIELRTLSPFSPAVKTTGNSFFKTQVGYWDGSLSIFDISFNNSMSFKTRSINDSSRSASKEVEGSNSTLGSDHSGGSVGR